MARPMKDSGVEWIGMVPKDWERIRYKYVMHKEKTLCESYKGESILSLTMGGVIIRDLEAGGKMPATFDGYQYVEPGNLLQCLFDIDVTPRCVGLVKDFGVTSPAYSRFVIHNNNCAAYYDYQLRAFDNQKIFIHLSKNLRSSLTESDFGMLFTVAPPLKEQQRIASFLDEKCSAIDNVVAKTQESIEEYKKLKQAVITEVVTKGVRGKRPMKDSGIDWIGQIPKEWDILKASRLFRENVRSPLANDISLSLSQEDGLIATDNMKEHSLKTSTYEGWKRVQLNDIVLNRFKGHLGVLFAATLEGMVSFHYGVFEPIVQLNSKYYEYLFHSSPYRAILANKSNGMVVGLQNLSNQNFYSVQCLMPSFSEQCEIADYLDSKCAAIDTLISKKQQFIDELTAYKKSLIYEFVTGKKEVPA